MVVPASVPVQRGRQAAADLVDDDVALGLSACSNPV